MYIYIYISNVYQTYMNDKKTCFKNSEKIFKTFFHIVFLEICDMCFVKPSEGLEKECENRTDQLDRCVLICCCRNIVRNCLIL